VSRERSSAKGVNWLMNDHHPDLRSAQCLYQRKGPGVGAPFHKLKTFGVTNMIYPMIAVWPQGPDLPSSSLLESNF